MRIYRITIRGEKYPMDFNVQASNWGTAISRAVKEWKQRFKRSRTDKLNITAIKSGELLKANGNEND